jgi:hypothetical protein
MPSPVDEASFAALVARFSGQLDEWRGLVRQVLVLELNGAGPWTLTAADHGGVSLLVSNFNATATISLTLPATASAGTIFLVDQVGPAPVKLVGAAGATIVHRLAHNGTAGRYASISAKCIGNSGGGSAQYLIGGDTALL